MTENSRKYIRFGFVVLVCFVLLATPLSAFASQLRQGGGPWWEVTPEPENPSSQYDSILYSEIAPKLREIEVNSNRVQIDVIGQSAGGRDMYLATVSAPEALGRLGQYQAIRNMMLKDPEKAQEMIEKFGDFKVPVFINGSIHGNEYPGVDAAIRLIETLAYDDSDEVREILENVILLVNVVQNPDGRVQGTRQNANGFDINRDFITQSQPETRATVKILTEWNPMVVLDLHGFVNPMLIEPCTPPHNPNYEYDLYIKWAFRQAEAMEAELLAQTGFSAQIPFRDFDLGWDDWPPTYTPMYGMYHGAYGHTLETPYRDERGVDAHYAAVWGALKFVVENRQEMIYDQIEIFRRGFLDLPQMRIPDELLNETQFDQFNDLIVQDFPAAYVIPQDAPFQYSDHQPARLIQFLLDNDVQVEKASQGFSLDGVDYPAGTYVVWMDQPKRGLANTILEAGPDLSYIEGLFFYSPPSVWSNPLLWGVSRAVMEEKIDIKTNAVTRADTPSGKAEGGVAGAYAYRPDSLQAYQATNELLARGVSLYRAEDGFEDDGRTFGPGTFVIPADPSLANELANQYALEVYALQGVPEGAVPLRHLRVAVQGDEGVRWAVRTLGFDYDALSASDVRAGVLSGYDVYVNGSQSWNGLRAEGQSAFYDFLAAGGDYIGLRSTGISFARSAGLISADTFSASGNAIVRLNFNQDSSIAAGYWETDFGFVFSPVWFGPLGEEVEVVASYDGGDFLVSGFWPGWDVSGAGDAPAVVYTEYGSSGVTLIGTDTTFRGHPENSFRLIGNAIFDGLE